ncbi:MAG: class I SAM-dependent methyltransferase [Planctomycetota bacterium]|nr:class I SAM-dependent methyltransferase [Planctomycetota bacterium]
MLKKLFTNFRKPTGFTGRLLVGMMNWAHGPGIRAVVGQLAVTPDDIVLDIGCGGGAAIALMAGKGTKVHGVDHSVVSVEKSLAKNRVAVRNGRVAIQVADALRLPFSGETFTLVTAFETIYFWENIQECFRRIHGVLRLGGRFAIALEGWKGENGEINCPKVFVDNLPITLYSEGELRESLLTAGFDSVSSLKGPSRKWLCVAAFKGRQNTPGK